VQGRQQVMLLRHPSLFRLDAGHFDEVLQVLWHHVLQQAQPVPDETISELDSVHGPIRLAVRRSQRFAALAWPLVAREADHLLAGYQEAFFVCPEGSEARLGWTTVARHEEPLPEPLRRLAPSPVPSPALPIPTFTELSTLAASDGRCSIPNPVLLARLEEALADAQAYREMAQQMDDELGRMEHKFSSLLDAFRSGRDQAPQEVREHAGDQQERQADLEGLLVDWERRNKDRLVLHSRAFAGAKQSLYEKPLQVLAGLDFLAGPYREHRLGKLPLAEYLQALQSSGFKLAGSVGDSVRGEQGEAYYVRHNGRRRVLSHHLVKGGGRDERYCLRIYFFFDDDIGLPVVGWLPSHLANSLS